MSHHRRRIAEHVHAERKVLRYQVGEHRFNERARLALGAIASTFRQERGRLYVAGDVANVLGDGQGWTARKTVEGLLRRDLVVGFQEFSVADPVGLIVLRELDRQYEEREKCKACDGRVFADRDRWLIGPLPADVCSACQGAGLWRRVPQVAARRPIRDR